MSTATKKSSNGVTLATSVAAVPAAAPAAPAAIVLKHPVNGTQVQAWLNAHCGGNPSLAGIKPLASAGEPGSTLPFLRGGNSARARILAAHIWGFSKDAKPGEPVNLAGATNYCKATFGGAFGINGYLDVCALLNGGFSPSSKVWGTPYAELVVLPAAGK